MDGSAGATGELAPASPSARTTFTGRGVEAREEPERGCPGVASDPRAVSSDDEESEDEVDESAILGSAAAGAVNAGAGYPSTLLSGRGVDDPRGVARCVLDPNESLRWVMACSRCSIMITRQRRDSTSTDPPLDLDLMSTPESPTFKLSPSSSRQRSRIRLCVGILSQDATSLPSPMMTVEVTASHSVLPGSKSVLLTDDGTRGRGSAIVFWCRSLISYFPTIL